ISTPSEDIIHASHFLPALASVAALRPLLRLAPGPLPGPRRRRLGGPLRGARPDGQLFPVAQEAAAGSARDPSTRGKSVPRTDGRNAGLGPHRHGAVPHRPLSRGAAIDT